MTTQRVYTTAVGLGMCQWCDMSIGAGGLVVEERWHGCRRYWHKECRDLDL